MGVIEIFGMGQCAADQGSTGSGQSIPIAWDHGLITGTQPASGLSDGGSDRCPGGGHDKTQHIDQPALGIGHDNRGGIGWREARQPDRKCPGNRAGHAATRLINFSRI